jgi:DNA modification methylase
MTQVPRNTVLVGDATDQLRRLPDASVDCVVTSPPYFALRDYEIDGQIGLEESVHDWVDRLVAVADELARVLKPHGSAWINLGDTYSRHDRYGAPPKGFLLAPERLLLELVERGWITRNKGVWAKPNPMPAPVYDRLACSWEPVYFLVRSRHYYFDLDAIRVPHRTPRRRPRSVRGPEPRRPGHKPAPRWAGPLAGDQSGLDRLKASGLPGHPLGKNPGDVWTIPKSSRRGGGHHATFPETLVDPLIRATCPERTCTGCGQPWRRHRTPGTHDDLHPGCDCDVGHRPGLTLDPFLGSGTTAVVAERLGRDWLGVELNPTFAAAARARLAAARRQPPPG